MLPYRNSNPGGERIAVGILNGMINPENTLLFEEILEIYYRNEVGMTY